MRNILLALLLANILYFMYARFVEPPPDTGVVVVDAGDLGPALELADSAPPEAATSVGAVLGTGRPTDLAAVVGRTCVSVGPFREAPDSDAALAELRGDGLSGSVRSTEGEIFVGHWVQIRNIPDREAGNHMLGELHDGGLGDAYLVETDDEGIKISLGLFGDVAGAERIELEAKSLGLPAEIAPRTREATVYFVDLELPPGRGASTIVGRYGEELVALRDAATCPRN